MPDDVCCVAYNLVFDEDGEPIYPDRCDCTCHTDGEEDSDG